MGFELQESSLWYGLCYIVASVSIYDEYSNDVLDMLEGSCFPRCSTTLNTLKLPCGVGFYATYSSENVLKLSEKLTDPNIEGKLHCHEPTLVHLHFQNPTLFRSVPPLVQFQ